jgi:uncharacterized membrane protein YwaF
MEWLFELKWGSFTPTHFISLAVSALIAFGLHFLLRNKSEKVQTWVMFVLSLYGVFALGYEIVVWGFGGYNPIQWLQYLPLHMCAYNSILTPVLILTKNKILGNMLPLFATGAAIALLFNSIQADYSIMSFTFFSYFLTHTLGVALPYLMLSLGHVKPHPRYILPTAATTVGLYTLSHFANLIINAYLASVNALDWQDLLIQVNYMFSITPDNPVLALFYAIIPHPYWYMYLSFAVIALYLAGVYFKDIMRLIQKK